jgi:hypothetical protein
MTQNFVAVSGFVLLFALMLMRVPVGMAMGLAALPASACWQASARP